MNTECWRRIPLHSLFANSPTSLVRQRSLQAKRVNMRHVWVPHCPYQSSQRQCSESRLPLVKSVPGVLVCVTSYRRGDQTWRMAVPKLRLHSHVRNWDCLHGVSSRPVRLQLLHARQHSWPGIPWHRLRQECRPLESPAKLVQSLDKLLQWSIRRHWARLRLDARVRQWGSLQRRS